MTAAELISADATGATIAVDGREHTFSWRALASAATLAEDTCGTTVLARSSARRYVTLPVALVERALAACEGIAR